MIRHRFPLSLAIVGASRPFAVCDIEQTRCSVSVIKLAVIQRGSGGFSSRGCPWISATSQRPWSTVSRASAEARCSRLPQSSVEPRKPRKAAPATRARSASAPQRLAASIGIACLHPGSVSVGGKIIKKARTDNPGSVASALSQLNFRVEAASERALSGLANPPTLTLAVTGR